MPKASTQPTRLYRIAVPSPLRRTFDYLPASAETFPAQVGCRVRIPFGARRVTGVVTALVSETDVPVEKLRRVEAVLDAKPLFPRSLLSLLVWAADYYQCPIGEVFAAALPTRLRAGEGLVASDERWLTPLAAADDETRETQFAALKRAPRQLALLQLLLARESYSAEEIAAACSAVRVKAAVIEGARTEAPDAVASVSLKCGRGAGVTVTQSARPRSCSVRSIGRPKPAAAISSAL